MPSPRARRILRRIVVGLLLAPIVFWLGLSVVLKLTVLEEAPFGDALSLVGQGLVQTVRCSITECRAELLEGMESVVFDERLL